MGDIFKLVGVISVYVSCVGTLLCISALGTPPPLTPPLGVEVEGGESLTPRILPWRKVNVHCSWRRGEGGVLNSLTHSLLLCTQQLVEG